MNFQIVNVKYSPYSDECDSKQALYCELTYRRDISNFAGVVFEFLDDSNEIVYDDRFCVKNISNINVYNNIRIGFEEEYIDSFIDEYKKMNPLKGIRIQFLVYTDVGSSQVVFERLAKLLAFVAESHFE